MITYFRLKPQGKEGTMSQIELAKKFKEYKEILKKDGAIILSEKDGVHPRFGEVKVLEITNK